MEPSSPIQAEAPRRQSERVKFRSAGKPWTGHPVPLLKSIPPPSASFGNNLALLDLPEDLVEALAPFVTNTHKRTWRFRNTWMVSDAKSARVGIDLPRCVAAVRKVKPKARFSLDMLTRDPLKIPCLTSKYWATFPGAKVQRLTRAINYVRQHASPQPLTIVPRTMDRDA
jgi:hypothetical protein